MNHQMISTTTQNLKRLFILLVMINYFAPLKPSYAGKQKKLAVSFTAKNISCYGLSDGQISLAVKGGVAPYSIKWNDGSDALQLNSLPAGTYDVQVSDAKGNKASQSINISEPYPLTAHGSASDEMCLGKNGSVSLVITGGTYPVSYSWSNGSAQQHLENIEAGDYSVQVIDANGCRTNASFNVSRKRELNVTVNKYNPVCANDATGLIDLDVKSGTEPYAFKWSNGAISEDVSGLAAGNYSVVITDKNNCSSTIEMALENPSPIIIEPVISDSDINKSNGSIALNVSGGAGNHKFLWNTLEETQIIKNLELGAYAVVVTDAHQCFQTAYFIVDEVAPMTVAGNVYNLLCHDDNTGMIDLEIEGGKKPYSIKWSDGNVKEDVSGAAEGDYTVVVTDANGMSITKSFAITQPETLTVFATVTDESAKGKSDGIIKLEMTGGTYPFTYQWMNDNNAQQVTALSPGLYSVEVTDAHQCKLNHEIIVSTQVNDVAALNAGDADTYQQMLRLAKANENAEEEITVTPNPFSNYFTIRFSDAVKNIKRIEIFSLEGKLLKQINNENLKPGANSISVNSSELIRGSYFVKINTVNKTYSKIVVKSN